MIIVIIIASRQSQLTSDIITVPSSRTLLTRACRRSAAYFLLYFGFSLSARCKRHTFRRVPIQIKRFRFFALICPVTASTINPFQISGDCKITINVLEETRRYSPRIRFNVFFAVLAHLDVAGDIIGCTEILYAEPHSFVWLCFSVR